MLCCAGLIGGLAIGQYLGGPWTFAAPAAGFGLGLLGDMTLMKGHHHHVLGSFLKKESEAVRGSEAKEGSVHYQQITGKT